MQAQDSYRYDTRSQWQSSNVADLDRQQDLASEPPRRDMLDTGKSAVDPMGASPQGKAEADVLADAEDRIEGADLAPQQAISLQPSSSLDSTPPQNGPEQDGGAAPSLRVSDDEASEQSAVSAPVTSAPVTSAPVTSLPEAKPEMAATELASNQVSAQTDAAISGNMDIQVSVALPNLAGGVTTHQAAVGLRGDVVVAGEVGSAIQSLSGRLESLSEGVAELVYGADTLLSNTIGAQGLLAQTQSSLDTLLDRDQSDLGGILSDLIDDGPIDLSALELGASDILGSLFDAEREDGADDDWLDGVLGETTLLDMAADLEASAVSILGVGLGPALIDETPGLDHGDAGIVTELADVSALASSSILGVLGRLGDPDDFSAHDPLDLSG